MYELNGGYDARATTHPNIVGSTERTLLFRYLDSIAYPKAKYAVSMKNIRVKSNGKIAKLNESIESRLERDPSKISISCLLAEVKFPKAKFNISGRKKIFTKTNKIVVFSCFSSVGEWLCAFFLRDRRYLYESMQKREIDLKNIDPRVSFISFEMNA